MVCGQFLIEYPPQQAVCHLFMALVNNLWSSNYFAGACGGAPA